MREKSPTVSPAAAVTRPLSTLPVPDSQPRGAALTLRRGEHRGWSHQHERRARRSHVMTAISTGREAISTGPGAVVAGYIAAVDATEVIEHHGVTVVRGRYDGTFDKTNLPDELILTSYFTVRDGKIDSLI